jgi:hypothetical protein
MASAYQARWVSKPRLDLLKKSGRLGEGMLLDSFNGFLIVEPVGSDLGDGNVLSPFEADYELQEVWCSGPKSKLKQARKLLGLADLAPSDTAASLA